MKLLFTIFLLCAITACTPQYDWREVRTNTQTAQYVKALFPNKPATVSRTVTLNATVYELTLTASQMGDEKTPTLFAVGYIRAKNLIEAQAITAALAQDWARKVDPARYQLDAKYTPTPTAAYEIIVLSPKDAAGKISALQKEAVDTFINNATLLQK